MSSRTSYTNYGELCKSCYRPFDDCSRRKATEMCGHSKCRECLQREKNACKQCPRRADNNTGSSSNSSPFSSYGGNRKY